MRNLKFGLQASPATYVERSDRELYADVIEYCALAHELGYEAVWMLEHHFSDYYPTPSPLMLLAHIAREFPDLGLGTAVLVLPWYHPMRLAEEISMLSNLTRAPVHIGMGRGVAKMEYDAFGVDMREARSRFAEAVKIIRLALSGEAFSHHGQHFSVANKVVLRPRPDPDQIRLYGAIGSPGSAGIMAELGLPPFCLATFPNHLLSKILAAWSQRNEELGGAEPPIRPVSIKMLMADTDAEAYAMGRRYLPQFFAQQADHYETDSNPWEGIEDYKDFTRMLGNLRSFTDPNNLDGFMKMNLVGGPDTVAARIEDLASLGFNYFMVGATLQGVPKEVQRDTARRFARDVVPRFAMPDAETATARRAG